MNHSHPHWLRSAIIAGIGLVIALISVVWVGIAIRSVGPKTLSLSYRIDNGTTLAFARATNKQELERSIRTLDAVFENERGPDLSGLPDGISYEYALVSGGEDKQAWFIDVHLKNQEEKLLMSETDSSSLLLPLTRIKASLGASTFFRQYEKNEGRPIVYVNVTRVPALTASGSGLLSASLHPFSSALILEKHATEHEWILLKKEASLFTKNATLMPIASDDPSVLAALSIGNPTAFVSALSETLTTRNPALREGIFGIALKRFGDITHRSDMEKALHDLAANGLHLRVQAGSGSSSFLIEGMATGTQAVQKWTALVRSSATPALIRTLTFLHGDRRTDVVAARSDGMIREEKSWEMLSIGSGSVMQLDIATKERKILIANDATLLEKSMHPVTSAATEDGRELFSGSVSRSWLLQRLKASVFMTQRELGLLQSIIDPKASSVRFHAQDGRDAITVGIRWRQ